jgi:hypothetical protein
MFKREAKAGTFLRKVRRMAGQGSWKRGAFRVGATLPTGPFGERSLPEASHRSESRKATTHPTTNFFVLHPPDRAMLFFLLSSVLCLLIFCLSSLRGHRARLF